MIALGWWMAKIFACGDVVNYGNNTGLLCDAKLESIISGADYSVCNFEAPIAGFGRPISKCGPHLQQDKKTLTGLKEQGFDLVLLANNHIMDYGRAGLKATIDAANDVGLDTVGAGLDFQSAYKSLVRDIAGVRVGIINACEAQFGVLDGSGTIGDAGYAWINHNKIDAEIFSLRKECDFVLLFAHAGLEDVHIPQKEWRSRYKYFCDLGVDVVIGSHPHVPQGYEAYNKSLIFYSLGNFYFDYGYAKNYKNHSYALMLHLEKGRTISFEPVHHVTNSHKVFVCEDEVDINGLCRSLVENYNEKLDEISLAAYRHINRQLISSGSQLPFDGTLFGSLKELVATILGRRKASYKRLVQLHYVRNETYHYAAKHALDVLSKNYVA
ncbi:MAG: hypothetical protein CMK74_04160 [Pseudomonadales bacterium]|jgi:poly-gamma-glutamate synthesis protein (capsule biosynthesis protein)|nr:hypothetical protein [Pseudomonadales bacterium]|tara:strand:+ start:2728 stop:3876 length:1149 start_codon:yes stop_codon:yes gene_type:complete